MDRRSITKRWLGIVATIALVVFGVSIVILPDARGARLKIDSARNYFPDKPAGQFVFSERRTLAIWCADAVGPNEVTMELRFLGCRLFPKGFFTLAGGKQVRWQWYDPHEKGGSFEIDGTPYDLAKGFLFLVSAKDGPLQVTQLDVDLSKHHGLPKSEPGVAKWIVDTSGEK